MGRLLFLAAESLLFTAVLGLSWVIIRRGFARVGFTLRALGVMGWAALGLVLLGVNFACTSVWGPSFTALYRLSGLALVGAIAIYALCVLGRRPDSAASEPS